MASFETRRARRCVALATGLSVLGLFSTASGQQPVQGFAVERFYPSAPGGGWFVMDDLNIGRGLGGAIESTGGYAQNPLIVTSPDGKQRLALVSAQAFIEIGGAVTYDRYRVYLNVPVPLYVSGNSGTLGPYQLTGPGVTTGTNPDTVSDPRLGFDVLLHGKPGNALRLGVGAQFILPSGSRADYLSDARYRGMLRFLVAGDSGAFSYAGQAGVHIRTLNDAPAPGSPHGSEFLFGGSVGRRFSIHPGWSAIVGPEIYGETAFESFFNSQQTGLEGLLTGRFERTGKGRNLRFKFGVGHSIVQNFGAPQWRVVAGVELFGERPGRGN
jgi:hypothetical protein